MHHGGTTGFGHWLHGRSLPLGYQLYTQGLDASLDIARSSQHRLPVQVTGMLLQQPVGICGLEMEGPEALARSRRGRTIKPKRRLDEEDEVPVPVKLSLRGAGSTGIPGRYRLDECVSEREAPRSTVLGALEANDNLACRVPTGKAWSSQHKQEDDKGFAESNACKAGGIFKTAAVQVLRRTGRLLCTGDITKIAVKYGYINVQGKTPDATMASALYTDIKRKEGRSIFIKPHEGLFGLREWWDMGYRFLDPKEQVEVRQAWPARAAQEPTSSLALPPRTGHKRQREADVETRRSWPRQLEPSHQSGCCEVTVAPAQAAGDRLFQSNMDVLFAAVDEVSRDEAGPASSEEDLAMGTSVLAAKDMSESEPKLTKAGLQSFSSEFDGSQVDRRSCSPSETASGPFPMAAGPVHIPEEVMKQLVAVSQAELVVQSLEANFTTHPTVLAQAYMQLCKLYEDAGMLEQACSNLAKAMEIGEVAARMA